MLGGVVRHRAFGVEVGRRRLAERTPPRHRQVRVDQDPPDVVVRVVRLPHLPPGPERLHQRDLGQILRPLIVPGDGEPEPHQFLSTGGYVLLELHSPLPGWAYNTSHLLDASSTQGAATVHTQLDLTMLD